MRLTKERKVYSIVTVLVVLAAVARAGNPTDSMFTYQGQLKLAGVPLTDTADFRFALWDSEVEGAQVGLLVPKDAVEVKNGLFQVQLDFSANALGGMRWLAISVRSPAGSGSFEPILSRQQITSSPYSIQTRGIFVDQNNNVGIGTANPQRQLDIEASEAVLRLTTTETTPSSASRLQLKSADAGAVFNQLGAVEFLSEDGMMFATIQGARVGRDCQY